MNCHFDTKPVFLFPKLNVYYERNYLTFWYFYQRDTSRHFFAAYRSEVKCSITAQDSVMGELAIKRCQSVKSAEQEQPVGDSSW